MASYPIPPWLNPPQADPARSFIAAFQTGASIANDRARLSQHAQDVALETAVKETELNRRAALEQQKLEIDKAQSQAMVGLKEQQLNLAAERARDQARQAAMNYRIRQIQSEQGQQRIDNEGARLNIDASKELRETSRQARSVAAQNEAQRRIQAGEDAQKVYMELGPAIQGGMTGIGSMMRQGQEQFEPGAAKELLDDQGNPTGKMMARTGRGSVSYFNKPRPAGSSAPPAAVPVPGAPGTLAIPKDPNWTYRSLPRPPNATAEEVELRKQIRALEARETLSPTGKKQLGSAKERLAEINDTKKSFATPPIAGTNTAPATRLRYNPATGKLDPVK